MLKVINIIIFILLTMPGLISAQYSIKNSVDRSVITIGDPIIYSITVEYSDEYRLNLSSSNIKFGELEILDFKITDQTIDPKKNIIKKIDYMITAYSLGEFEIPSQPIELFNKANNAVIVMTEPLLIKVVPVKKLPGDTIDIRDLKKPISIHRKLIGFFILFFLISVLMFFLYKYYFKNMKLKPVMEPVVQQPLMLEDELAIQKIKILKNKNLLENKKFKQFYFELSEIIREYIHNRYQIIALERTTFEIMHDLRHIISSPDIVLQFQHFFDLCDLIKFAKYIPDNTENKNIIPAALDLIYKTRRILVKNEIS